MGEKILIRSESNYPISRFVKMLVAFLAIIAVVIVCTIVSRSQKSAAYEEYQAAEMELSSLDSYDFDSYDYYAEERDYLDEKAEALWQRYKEAGAAAAGIAAFLVIVSVIPFTLAVIFLVLHLMCRNKELVITNRRVYGVTKRTRVDLPLDSITSIGLVRKGTISVSTPSGRLVFVLLKNRDKMYYTLCDLLVARNADKCAPKAEATEETNDAE